MQKKKKIRSPLMSNPRKVPLVVIIRRCFTKLIGTATASQGSATAEYNADRYAWDYNILHPLSAIGIRDAGGRSIAQYDKCLQNRTLLFYSSNR